MSYRHSSYRKVKKGVEAARQSPDGGLARHHGNRISHWLNARPLDKRRAWGKPKAGRW
jgi:hypothetical protein